MSEKVTEDRTISVVVPVYYNENSLHPLNERLGWFEGELEARGMKLELIFVDDGSGDNSFEELKKIRARRAGTKLIRLTKNFGSVAASKTGLEFVTGDCFAVLAADLQDPVEVLLEMVDHWLAGKQFVVASRASRDDPIMTRFYAAIYYWIVRSLVLPDYPRGGFDLMLMDKSLLKSMQLSGKNTNPNMYAYWLGFEAKIVTYHRQARSFGKSRWTFSKKLKFFADTITGFSVVPIRILSLFGLLAALLSFLYGMYIFAHAFFTNFEVPGFPTLVVLITFFSGLILVMLGVIGEYLWRVFDATSGKPESVILETHL